MNPTSISVSPVAEHVARCRLEQEAWSRLPVRQRLRPVRAFRRLLVRDCDSLCAAVARDLGKTTEETLGTDILPLADACSFLQREADHLLKARRIPVRLRPVWL